MKRYAYLFLLIPLILMVLACRQGAAEISIAPAASAVSEPVPQPTATVPPTATLTFTPPTHPAPTSPALPASKPPGEEQALPSAAPRLNREAAETQAPPIPFSPPEIPGLQARQVGEGAYEYAAENGSTILLASAYPLREDSPEAVRLKQILEELYPPESPYREQSTYPRFQFTLPGVQAGFFGLDQTLTLSQILRMKEALEIFNRPEFSPFPDKIFSEDISYVVIEELEEQISGLNYAGTGIVLLDRRDLFGSKYLLASVIAHEGVHILQGRVEEGFTCDKALGREIGSGAIAPDFLRWDAARVLTGVEAGSIGAYHVTYWILNRLGFTDLTSLRQVIQTGRVNGKPVVICESE